MRFARLFASLGMLALAPGCVKLTLAWADLSPNGDPAAPSILAEESGVSASARDNWRTARAPALREDFEKFVYGAMPDSSSVTVVDRKLVDAAGFNGAGRVEEYVLRVTAVFNGVSSTSDPFVMNVVTPTAASGPSPVIMMETFCQRWDTIPHPDVSRPDGSGSCNDSGSGIMKYVFGRYIATPPIEMILSRGYGVAAVFPGDVAPDRREEGLAALAALSEGHEDDDTRWGAIGAWGWIFSRMVDAMVDNEFVDEDGFVTFGHSRYGKAALVAAAYDERIAAVIAHQSGTGGASLNRRKKGESVNAITSSYPHWFSRKYASYAGREEELPIDQHHLLALIAPRPVLLGNARRDVWSDPNGAFRAAIGADPIYEMFGVSGLDQSRLNEFNPAAELSFWIRPGTHGVVKEDWPAFLEFLDAHFDAEAGS